MQIVIEITCREEFDLVIEKAKKEGITGTLDWELMRRTYPYDNLGINLGFGHFSWSKINVYYHNIYYDVLSFQDYMGYNIVKENIEPKQFKNKFSVKSDSIVLLNAFVEELKFIGHDFKQSKGQDTLKNGKKYVYIIVNCYDNNNLCGYANHKGNCIEDYNDYILPDNWNQVIELAKETIEHKYPKNIMYFGEMEVIVEKYRCITPHGDILFNQIENLMITIQKLFDICILSHSLKHINGSQFNNTSNITFGCEEGTINELKAIYDKMLES